MTSFWTDLENNTEEIEDDWQQCLVLMSGVNPLTKKDAQWILDVLWRRSHLMIAQHMPEYKKHFPTTQKYKQRLGSVSNLWWVDHGTAGVNGWGTLGWFSSKKRKHARKFSDKKKAEAYAKRKKGQCKAKGDKWLVTWKGLAGASTHFVLFPDGTPFYLIDIDSGCWGEPKRNGDGIHIEMVNPLVVHRKKGEWRYWAGPIPQKMLEVQQPAELDRPFRGITTMMPYTWDQIVMNIKLKRVCIAATSDESCTRMARERMSQHTDWRPDKFDMGPLWPVDLCNDAAFENFPIEEYQFVQQFMKAEGMDAQADKEEVKAAVLHHEGILEEHAQDPNGAVHDLFDEDESIDSIKEVQQALIGLYGPGVLPKYGADGDFGRETVGAVKKFQVNWNRTHPQNLLKVDGIPGVQTCTHLEQALLLHSAGNFPLI